MNILKETWYCVAISDELFASGIVTIDWSGENISGRLVFRADLTLSYAKLLVENCIGDNLNSIRISSTGGVKGLDITFSVGGSITINVSFNSQSKWKGCPIVESTGVSICNLGVASTGTSGGGGSDLNKSWVIENFWNKKELFFRDLYLMLGESKIKAGFSDNSDLWSGHDFPDFLDHPLKSDSDVTHKSLRSPDFESKVKGWLIDALGNSEFRDILGRFITLTGGLMTDDFVAGMAGTGTGIVKKSEVHTDRGVFRKYIEVLALVVSKMYWRGGRQCLSPAGMKISRIEEFEGYWRCYMETEDGQTNEFTVGALARCNNYGNGTQKYYWRLVTGIGEDYIDLSKTDCDTGSGTPAIGDDVVQFRPLLAMDRHGLFLLR